MSQDMNDPQFKKECALIWEDMSPHSSVDEVRSAIKIHPKSIFLGYVEITLGRKLACGFVSKEKIRGIEIKILGGKPHLDFPGNKNKAEGKFYPPNVFPRTPHDRMVWTALVFGNPGVMALVNEANAIAEAAKTAPAVPAASGFGSDESEMETAPAIPNPF